MNTNDTANHPTETQTQTSDPLAFSNKMHQFIELRAKGLSLRKISEQIGVPKSTLYEWNLRNRGMLTNLKQVELEDLQERLLGSQEEQLTALTHTLKRLEKAFAKKLREDQDDLSPTALFWMASNLRFQIQRLHAQAPLADVPELYRRRPWLDPFRTNPDKTPPPTSPCP